MLADNNVMVTKVTVTVLSDEGKRLEQAEAKPYLKVWWDYQATHRGLIRVEAWDFASNVTRQEFIPSSPNDVWQKTRRR